MSWGLKVCAQALPPRTLCARSLALRRAASPHPALTRHLPRSADRYPRRHLARRHRSLRVVLTGMHHSHSLAPRSSIITTFNGTTLNGTARDDNTIDALGLCRLSLAVPVSRQVAVAGSHAFACRTTPPPDTCPLVPLVVLGAVQT